MTDSSLLLPAVSITEDCNYVAAFLTFACPYRCSYCINSFESAPGRYGRMMRGGDWIRGLSRLTNLSFDVEEMIAQVNPERLRREAPYASIRVSYHPQQMDLEDTLAKTHRLQQAGFSIGIWSVRHPEQEEIVLAAQERATREGIDFRLKEFLGYYNGTLHGEYKYPDACTMQDNQQVECRTTELIIGPGGEVYRCHHDLYENYPPVGHILDPAYQQTGAFRPCDCYGHCNPCDVKVKTNRLQQFGHTSVEIKFARQERSVRRSLATART